MSTNDNLVKELKLLNRQKKELLNVGVAALDPDFVGRKLNEIEAKIKRIEEITKNTP